MRTFIAFLIFWSLSFAAIAADVTLQWDANTEPDLKGYRLYYGTASGNYASNIDVGMATTHTVEGLATGTWYFALKAYDTLDQESGFSNEVKTRPNDPTNLRIVVIVTTNP